MAAVSNAKWRIRWNKTTGLPVSLWLGETNKAYPGSAEQSARAFLADYQTLFGFASLNQLKYVRTQTNKGVSHVTFNQTVDGVPVYDAEFKVHIRQDGHIVMANGYYYPNIQLSTTPGVSASSAGKTAQTDLRAAAKITVPVTSSKLVIYRDQKGQFHLAWKLVLFSEQPMADWLYFVDAQSGQVIDKLSQLTDITGDGNVYPTYPGLSSVTDAPLYRLDGNGYLRGTWAYIVNDATSEAYSSGNSFRYSSTNTHFDEANLYKHIDEFRENYIENIALGSYPPYVFTQMRAHAHTPVQDLNGDGILDPNSWFSHSTQQLYFNDAYPPDGTNDFAKEDKIIYHEYSHAAIYYINSGIESTNNEEGGISEGVPDYFAGAYTGRTKILDYVLSLYPSDQRDMANPYYTSYSSLPRDQNGNVNVDPHESGEFFSSILWSLRNTITPFNADHTVFDAFYWTPNNPTFLDFRDAMMTSDYNGPFGGADDNAIQDAFYFKGIGTYSLKANNITGSGFVRDGSSYTWYGSASGGKSPYSITWYKRATSGDPWLGVGSGTSYSETISSRNSFQLRTCVTDNNNMTACSNTFQVTVH